MRKLTATLCLALAVLLGACESKLIKHSEKSAYVEKGLPLSEFLATADKFCSSKPSLESERTYGISTIKVYSCYRPIEIDGGRFGLKILPDKVHFINDELTKWDDPRNRTRTRNPGIDKALDLGIDCLLGILAGC